MVSGWPEVGSCDQLAPLPSIRLGRELGLPGSRAYAHNHFCVFIDKLEGSCTDPRANRVAPGASNTALNSATAARRAPPNLRPLKSVMSKPGSCVFYQLL